MKLLFILCLLYTSYDAFLKYKPDDDKPLDSNLLELELKHIYYKEYVLSLIHILSQSRYGEIQGHTVEADGKMQSIMSEASSIMHMETGYIQHLYHGEQRYRSMQSYLNF